LLFSVIYLRILEGCYFQQFYYSIDSNPFLLYIKNASSTATTATTTKINSIIS